MSVGNTIGKLTNEPMLPSSTPAGSANPPEKKSWWSKWGDVVHTGLDILGAVPVIGIVADGANAAIYAAEGDYVNAAISGASAAANLIPGGGAAMKAGKAAVAVGKQALKATAKEGAEALAKKAAKEAAEKAAKEGAEAAGKKAAKKAGSDAGGGVKGKGKKAKKSCKNGACVGRPVNPVLGIKFLGGEEDLDFDLPAPLSLPWQRSYYSDQTGNGWLGQGWSLPLSSRLLRMKDHLLLIDEQGREIELPELDEGEQELNRYESIVIRRDANGRYRISSPDGSQHFVYAPLDLDGSDAGGERANYLPLVAIEDRNGNRARLVYGESGLPRQLIDAAGRELGLSFDRLPVDGTTQPRLCAVALLRGEPDASGTWPQHQIDMLVHYDYSAHGDLVRVRGGDGKVRREYAYRNHILIEHSKPGGLVARYEYDQYSLEGRVLLHTTSVGQSWRFTYLPEETLVTDNLGRQTRYRFNADTELTGMVDEAGGETRIELNAWGNPTAVTDAAGYVTRYTYDDAGNTSAIVDPTGARTEVQYHETWHLPISVTDAMGAVTRYDYDAAGNLIRETDALGQVTAYNHDERGLVVRITDAHGGKRRLEYDAFGQLVAHVDCIGNTVRYRWDDRGNQLAVEHADGTAIEYAYDDDSRLKHVRFADGSSESFAYDDAGRMIRHVDTGGAATEWEFAHDSLPVARINALNQRLSYQYDAARRLVVLTNENGAYYRLAYDTKNNLVGEQGFEGRVSLYYYDAADNLVEQRELGIHAGPGVELAAGDAPELLRMQYTRDPVGRVLEKITGRAKDKRIQKSSYEYDLVGRITGAVNEGGRVSLAYDEIGQLVEEASLNLGRTQTVRHSYDQLGNRTRSVLPDGRILTQHYYGPGYLHRVEVDGEIISEIERDVMQRETVRRQGAITSYFDYDVMGRVTGQRARKDGVSAQERVARRYLYDRAGNLQASSDLRFGQISYQYDPLGRLTKANNERFSFDPAHNLVDRDGEVVRNNRLTSYEDKQFSYDTHGNMTHKRIGEHTVMRFSYDPEHQLESAEIVRNGVKQLVSYGYDALGRRTWKRDGFGTTEFFWEGNRLLQEIRHSRRLTYLYEPSSFVPFAQLESALPVSATADTKPPAVRYFHNDHIGTPRELSESDGRISWRASYRAWGNTLVVEYPEVAPTPLAETVHQPLRFQGQYYDAETGLHYNRFRYYDPDVGRFVTQDPIGLMGGENLFVYAPNPTGWIDPNGLAKKLPSGTYATHSTRTKTAKVKGRNVINKCYAGKVFPAEHLPSAIRGKYPHGVPFNIQGFPDFSRYATKTVNIKLGASRGTDFSRSNRAAFGAGNPYGSSSPTINGKRYTWHHHQESGKMQLIPEDIHDAVKHTGGVACDI